MRWRRGKTLALAAQTHNRGQIYAYDEDGRRLMPIHERLERAGARNIQFAPARQGGRADGPRKPLRHCADRRALHRTGTWPPPGRQWRLAPGALDLRQKDQRELLERAARYVKPKAACLCDLLAAARRERGRIGEFLSGHKSSWRSPRRKSRKRRATELARFASLMA